MSVIVCVCVRACARVLCVGVGGGGSCLRRRLLDTSIRRLAGHPVAGRSARPDARLAGGLGVRWRHGGFGTGLRVCFGRRRHIRAQLCGRRGSRNVCSRVAAEWKCHLAHPPERQGFSHALCSPRIRRLAHGPSARRRRLPPPPARCPGAACSRGRGQRCRAARQPSLRRCAPAAPPSSSARRRPSVSCPAPGPGPGRGRMAPEPMRGRVALSP